MRSILPQTQDGLRPGCHGVGCRACCEHTALWGMELNGKVNKKRKQINKAPLEPWWARGNCVCNCGTLGA